MPERPCTCQVLVLERTDSLRDEPVEAPDPGDGRFVDSLILVR
jgi:hypothetical protein